MLAAAVCGALQPLLVQNAAAASTVSADSFTPSEVAVSYSYYVTLGRCVQQNMRGDFTTQNAESPPSDWFDDNTATGYVFPGGAKLDCKDIASKALSTWGWSASSEFLTAMKYTYQVDTAHATAKYHGTSDGGSRLADFQAAVKAKVYGGNDPVLTGPANYAIARDAFLLNGGSCAAHDLGAYSDLNATDKAFVDAGSVKSASSVSYYVGGTTVGSAQYVRLGIADTSGASVDHGYVYNVSTTSTYASGNGGAATVDSPVRQITYGYHDQVQQPTCQELAKSMNDNLGAYKAWVKGHQGSTDQGAVTCKSNSSDPVCAAASAPSCGGTVHGIGWMLCPLFDAIGGLDDAMWHFIAALLTTSPLSQTNPDGTTSLAYQVWGVFRSFANVALGIAFLVIVFSQLSSLGVSNYGVKKLLPRLIVAAILINVSFIVMQLAVDLANVIGKSVYDLLNGIIGSPTPPTWSGLLTTVLSLTVTGGVLAGAIAIAPEAAVMLLLPGAIAAVLGFLAAVLTLMFRQAIIPILAVIAPLAFVAYLLPNTRSWFDKWRNLFVSMLVLFPMAAVLFAGTKMAAALINSGGQWWQTLTALIVLGAPLFLLPFLARQSGPLLGKLNSGLQGLSGRLQKPVGSWAGKRRDASLARSDATTAGRFNVGKRLRQAVLQSGRRRDLKTAAYQAQSTANFNRDLSHSDVWAGDVRGADAQAFIRGAKAKAEAEELKAAQTPLEDEVAAIRAGRHTNPTYAGMSVDDFLKHRATDMSRSATERDAAVHKAASLGRDGVIRELSDPAAYPSVNPEAIQRAIGANAGALVGKAPDLVKGAAAFDGFTGKDMAGWSEHTATAFMRRIETMTAAGNTAGASQALADFASAARDIQANPNLQGEFNAKTGAKFQAEATRMSALPGMTGIAGAFGAIGADGKIR